MSKETLPVMGVTNTYGVRNTGGTLGAPPSYGSRVEVSVDLDVATVNSGLLNPIVIPAGSKIVDVFVVTETAFTITTSAAKGYVGAKGAESTNGIQIDDTVFETVGVVKLATGKLLGTFNDASSYISADTTVAFSKGTLDPSGTAGKLKLIITYLKTAL